MHAKRQSPKQTGVVGFIAVVLRIMNLSGIRKFHADLSRGHFTPELTVTALIDNAGGVAHLKLFVNDKAEL